VWAVSHAGHDSADLTPGKVSDLQALAGCLNLFTFQPNQGSRELLVVKHYLMRNYAQHCYGYTMCWPSYPCRYGV